MESSPHYNAQEKLTDEKVKREAIEVINNLRDTCFLPTAKKLNHIPEDKYRAKIDPVALDVTWGNDPRYWCINKNKL
ncbi:hypothetical protein C4D60_Mb11t12420 [Musa balbisiana]|uniref:Uncharacterized protein n=1 Tax=Musa balbisiana TaxID=52838 RepID=A0A4S8J3N3_MUSBA|nr:hypothetical protein C4D60_Mb11t12420 [Musa balbisiana]